MDIKKTPPNDRRRLLPSSVLSDCRSSKRAQTCPLTLAFCATLLRSSQTPCSDTTVRIALTAPRWRSHKPASPHRLACRTPRREGNHVTAIPSCSNHSPIVDTIGHRNIRRDCGFRRLPHTGIPGLRLLTFATQEEFMETEMHQYNPRPCALTVSATDDTGRGVRVRHRLRRHGRKVRCGAGPVLIPDDGSVMGPGIGMMILDLDHPGRVLLRPEAPEAGPANAGTHHRLRAGGNSVRYPGRHFAISISWHRQTRHPPDRREPQAAGPHPAQTAAQKGRRPCPCHCPCHHP